MVKLDKAAGSATCEDETSQTLTTLPIEVTTSFQSLLNNSVDEEVLPETTKALQDSVTQPYPWRTGQKKQKRRRRPRIVFESAQSEIEALSDTCALPPGAQAKLQPRENCQAAQIIKNDLAPRAIILYGVPQP